MTPPRLPSNLPRAVRNRTLRERDRRSVADFLRLEVTGGALLLVAATLALVLANSPVSEGYATVRDHHVAVPFLGLDLSVGHWASDGLLAVFFFVAGTELKRELTVGELRRPADAALPVIAAVGGMVTPALLYLAVALPRGGALDGWAVPMATDIAFVLGVLAVVGRRLPGALRTFLLTLAIVDDLIAILVIAVFFTSRLDVLALAGAAAGLLLFRLLHARGVRGWYVYLPLALAVWTLTYHSGVHATIAGVALGTLLRATPREGEERTPAERVGHLVHPLSAGVAVPLFAVFAAGVPVSPATLGELAGEPEAVGVVAGLFLGKLLGVLGATWLTVRFTGARLSPRLGWPDIAGGALLAGIGFTVALLIAELAFAGDPELTEHVKAAVLLASLLAAASAAVVLTLRGRRLARRAGSRRW